MNCQNNPTNPASDSLELLDTRRSSDSSANAWLIRQGVQYLHSADEQDASAYKYVIELLSRNEAADAVVQIARTAPQADISLRWSLLQMLGELADKRTAKWLVQFSVTPLPERGEGCEGPRDSELLLRTMAIESLGNIAKRHPETASDVMRIISARPDRAVLIEAVKVAMELGLKDKAAEILAKEDHWILDIKKARAEELHAEPERADTKERSFTPPKRIGELGSPSIKCACKKGGLYNG